MKTLRWFLSGVQVELYERSGVGAAIALWLAAAFVLPLVLAYGLWLLGVPIDWTTWKTYLGLFIVGLIAA